jgi:hypothetical protein
MKVETPFDLAAAMRTAQRVMMLLILVTACDSEEGSHRVIHTEVQGIPLVKTEGAPLYGDPLFDVREDLVLGTDTGEPEWQLFATPWLSVGPDGTMYVADASECRIHIVSPDGTHEGTFGRKGQGPGEISAFLWSAFWVSDELWVDDDQLRRFQRFGRAGDFLGTISYGDQRGHYSYLTKLTDTRWLGERDESLPQLLDYYVFVDNQLQYERDFLVLEGQTMVSGGVGGTGPYYPSPFDYPSSLAVYPDGRMLVAEPEYSRLTVYSLEGEPLLRFEREWPRYPVTQEEREAWMESRRDNPRYTEYLRNIEFPEYHASFDRILVDDHNRAWIRRSRPVKSDNMIVGYEFDLFSDSGTWLGTQRLPVTPQLIQKDRIYARTFGNEKEGPRIRRYILTPRWPDLNEH